MGAILSALSNVLYLGEKVVLWVATGAVLTCIIVTLVMMLGLGVGLGYNYCFVDIKTKHKYVPGYYEYDLRKSRRYKGLRSMQDRLINDTDAWSNETEKGNEKLNKNIPVKTDFTTTTAKAKTVVIDDIDEFDATEEESTEVNEISSSSKTVVQIDGLDLMTLLSKLKAENRNYTLQIVTT